MITYHITTIYSLVTSIILHLVQTKHLLILSITWCICSGVNIITTWNKSTNFPATLSESISGYNRHDNEIYILGGYNGTHKTNSLFTFNTNTKEFTYREYSNKITISAFSYTWVRDSMFFTDNFSLYELLMVYNFNYEPRLEPQGNLPLTHYADTPSITTDQTKYLFITGGIVNGSIVNTLSIYDKDIDTWISTETPNMKYSRLGHNCISRNNYLYVFGGYINATHMTNTIEKLYIGDIDNIDLESWYELNNTLINNIAYMRIAEFNGLLYIIGGYSETLLSSVDTVSILDPNNDEIISGVNLSHPTNRGAVTENINGNIYLFGGYGNSSVLSMYQWSISDTVENKSMLWLYMTIIGTIVVFIFTLCFIFGGYKWYRYRKFTVIADIDRSLSQDGAGPEGRIVVHKEYSASKYVVDTSSFHSLD
eukprot:17737_1